MFFEDFKEGTTYRLEPVGVSEADIRRFARDYDPQRLHIDPEFARRGPFGGLIASGYHTLAIVWRQWIDADILGDESMGGPGLNNVQWLAPLRPGDVLHTTVTVTEARESKNPRRGVVSFHFDVENQAGQRVMAYDGAALVRRRTTTTTGRR